MYDFVVPDFFKFNLATLGYGLPPTSNVQERLFKMIIKYNTDPNNEFFFITKRITYNVPSTCTLN